jgi:5-methylcytosine-specific restriction endonuclease McrA
LKAKVRVQQKFAARIAQHYGLIGNSTYVEIAAAISKERNAAPPRNKREAKALIAAHELYGQAASTKRWVGLKKEKLQPPPTNEGGVRERAQRLLRTYFYPYYASREFLESYEWRVLRMRVLKRDGARCACCGSSPADGVRMNVDHIKPRKHFPQLALDENNLQVLCEVCNHGKSNWDATDWRFAHVPSEETERQIKEEFDKIMRRHEVDVERSP